MAGVVLETLSNRKLFAFGIVLLLVQLGFFLIGGLIGNFITFALRQQKADMRMLQRVKCGC